MNYPHNCRGAHPIHAYANLTKSRGIDVQNGHHYHFHHFTAKSGKIKEYILIIIQIIIDYYVISKADLLTCFINEDVVE